MPLQLDTTALVVVDVQNGFVTADSAPVVPIIVDLVRRWQAADGQTIFTRYHNYPDSPYERLVGWYGLHEAKEVALVDELAPLVDHPRAHVIDKTIYSMFTDEGRALLARLAVTDLLICGIATDGCVLKTALDAFETDRYTPWLLADACASNATRVPAQDVHRAALMLASRLVGAGQVLHSDDALAQLPEGTLPPAASATRLEPAPPGLGVRRVMP